MANLGDEPKVDQAELGPGLIVGSDEVAGVGVRVEESRLEQLHQEALLTNLDELLDFAGFTIRELLPIDPLADEHAAGGVIIVHLGDHHVLNGGLLEHPRHPLHVCCLVLEVELSVEAHRPLVEQRHVVGALLRREATDETLVDLGGAAEDI